MIEYSCDYASKSLTFKFDVLSWLATEDGNLGAKTFIHEGAKHRTGRCAVPVAHLMVIGRCEVSSFNSSFIPIAMFLKCCQ